MSRSKIRVDKDGQWYFEGRPIIRRDILQELLGLLQRDEEGRYWLCYGQEREPVEVEDTVFLVEEIQRTPEGFRIRLNDGTKEDLDPSSLRFSPGGVPYCLVKGGRFPARLTRRAFYQLGEHVIQEGEAYFIEVKGRRYRLA